MTVYNLQAIKFRSYNLNPIIFLSNFTPNYVHILLPSLNDFKDHNFALLNRNKLSDILLLVIEFCPVCLSSESSKSG